MPRENSFSDSDGRSLTPDLDEEEMARGGAPPISPTYSTHPPLVSEPHAVTQNHASTSKVSLRSRVASNAARPTLAAIQSPNDRFRKAVRKIISLHRSTTMLSTRGVGAEPGVDPRRASADLLYGGIKKDCVIELFDYSSVRSSVGRMTNKEFVHLMEDRSASKKESWVKVRWINIGGMSWDVIKAVSIKYDLHPLALEDVFHTRSQTRSKADYYTKHLFLRILCHELGDPDELPQASHSTAAFGSTLTNLPRSSSPEPFRDSDHESYENGKGEFGEDEKTMYNGSMPASRRSTAKKANRRRLVADLERGRQSPGVLARLIGSPEMREAERQRQAQELTINLLKQGNRVNVKVQPVFIFLTRDGTVISICPNPNMELTKPISNRLQQRDTVLRTSADPSLLVQSLLDLIVDKALEVIDEYHVKIKKFERDILIAPKIRTVQDLHILSGDLILHKRTLEPIKTLVYGLRRYDLDRVAALVDSSNPAAANAKVVGYMSHKSKIYLADVYDHMEYILTSLDMFANIGENLINYTFNMTSYNMNETMRQLTLATIIFLPLTLLTGYFGMNFESMWSVNKHSDVLFWIIALPLMVIIIPLFLMSDLKRILHFVQKKIIAKSVKKYLKED